MKLSIKLVIATFGLALFLVYLRLEPMGDDAMQQASNAPNLTTVEIGQVWVLESDDPFNPESREYVILDTLSGWVKYCKVKYVERPDRDEFSMTAKQETIARIMRLKQSSRIDSIYNNLPKYRMQIDSIGRVRLIPNP